MNKIRKIISSSFLIPIFVFSLFTPSFAEAELVDRIVAIVNDDVITFSDLNREGAALFRRITQQAPPEQVQMALLQAREEMLSNLIDKLIVEQRARKIGVTVDDAEVDSAVTRIIARNNTTPEKFRQQLELMGTSEKDYRELIRNQILQDRLVEYEIRSRVVVTEERMKEYYEKHYAEKTREEAYHILQIGISWKDDSAEAKNAAKQRATEVREQAVAGEDFRSLAKQHSDLPSAADGGDIGVFAKDEMSAVMKHIILNLKAGQISPIEETPAGYQFFKLLSDRGDINLQGSYDSVKEEIRKRLYEDDLNTHFQKWVKELREEAYIKNLL